MKNKNLFFALFFALFATMNVACSKDDDEVIKDKQENTEDKDDDNTGDTDDKEDDKEEDKDGDTSEFDCLKGSDYYLFSMDGNTEQKISSKITLDCRPNETSVALYIWDGTYEAATASGPNFFGEVESWTALSVGSAGWSGMGICVITPANGGALTVDMTNITPEHTFHIAMRSTDNATHLITLIGGDGNQASIAIGDTPFTDNDKVFQPYTNFKRDGEWNTIEIPMSEFFDRGLVYRNKAQNDNLVTFLSGGVSGRMLHYDAMFIYKKK